MRGIAFLLIFFVVVAGIFYLLTGWSYSNGERAGTISKFSHRGYLFKTYEGVLNVGGFSGETGSLTPQFFNFSVKNDSIANKINEAVRSGQRVTLHYEEKIVKLPWNGDTKYFVTSVDIVDIPSRYGYPGQTAPPPVAPQEMQPQPSTQPQSEAVYDTTNAL